MRTVEDKDEMTEQEHAERHKVLHRCLDELIADWIGSGPRRYPTKCTIYELMKWSNGQTKKPDDRGHS